MNYGKRNNYYAVCCKCGHTGSRRTYIPIEFGVIASSGKEAAFVGRMMPRCKHNHKDCVLSVRKISLDEYILIIKRNNNDPYLNCHSIQEQRQYDLSDRFVSDSHFKDNRRYNKDHEERKSNVFYGKNRIKKPRKFIRFTSQMAMEECY